MKMSNKLRLFVCVALLLTISTVLHAEDSGWTVNPNAYRYDMTVYGKLVVDDATVTDYSNYEVGAFVGEECRGVATVYSQSGYTWLYIRVRSNSESGETVKFKLFDKTTGETSTLLETVAFESLGQVGVPSSPTTLTLSDNQLGDANGDGKVNILDFTAIASYIIGTPPAAFIETVADINSDGKINVLDLTALVTIILNGNVE